MIAAIPLGKDRWCNSHESWFTVYHSPLTKKTPPFEGCGGIAIYFSDGISALTLMFLSRNPEASSLSTPSADGGEPGLCVFFNSGDSGHHGGVSATGICLVYGDFLRILPW